VDIQRNDVLTAVKAQTTVAVVGHYFAAKWGKSFTGQVVRARYHGAQVVCAGPRTNYVAVKAIILF
jgi:hypothetical protein